MLRLGTVVVVAALCGSGLACLSSGVCGSSCAPPPPAPCAPATCSPGYSCGQYGCARNRARSALTKKIDGIFLDDAELASLRNSSTSGSHAPSAEAAVISRNIFGMKRTKEEYKQKHIQIPAFDNATLAFMTNPNNIFRQCCEQRRLPDACVQKCNFNTYTRDALQSMYFKTDGCPLEAATDMQFCAAQGRDHTECCARNGVTTTLAGSKCLTFCDQRPDQVTRLDYSYIPCYDRFENMKRCFYNDIKSTAERQFSRR